jgi:hypothetical protein
MIIFFPPYYYYYVSVLNIQQPPLPVKQSHQESVKPTSREGISDRTHGFSVIIKLPQRFAVDVASLST